MAYNNRMSQQFRSGNQQNRSTKKKEEDSDAFMRLPDAEIAGCISDIGVPFTSSDLIKPNPQQIQLVFEWFAELLMNTTRETVEPAMRAAAEDVYGEFVDIMPADTRNLVGFYTKLRHLMIYCGVNDFSFSDLNKPTHDRLVKIFSYIINFVRFRESQTATIDKHFNKSETTKARIESLYNDNQDMAQRLEEMKHTRKAMESQVKEKIKRNEELKTRLLELRKGQERIAERMERVRAEKSRNQTILEGKTEKLVAARQECEKLRPYTLQSPAALQTALTELSESLQRDKSKIEQWERRSRALQTSADSFAVVQADVSACIKLLEEISSELQKEEDEGLQAAKNRDALSERGNSVREVQRTEALLQRQLNRWNDRIDALRKSSDEKAREAREKMDELRTIHRQLTDERADKGREMERRKVRIEQTEKKMADLKENIEAEVHGAHDEYLKLESHIELYITEMEQSLGV